MTSTTSLLTDIVTSAGGQQLQDGKVNMDQLAIDIIAGEAVRGAVANKISRSQSIKILERQVDRLERLTSISNPKQSRVNDLNNVQKKIEMLRDVPAQATTSVIQKVGSEIIKNAGNNDY